MTSERYLLQHSAETGTQAADTSSSAWHTLPWTSGVEAHDNRIKRLERQMFGRAGFALLRQRVLLAATDVSAELRRETT
ncbi:hypothetical protein [Streptomyces sp. NPDC058620]|uniref:hypothetical protein n=1 Tax=Streptomyces sp. NPDC058620 TaxID=3346560 RepID=UPI00365368FF